MKRTEDETSIQINFPLKDETTKKERKKDRKKERNKERKKARKKERKNERKKERKKRKVGSVGITTACKSGDLSSNPASDFEFIRK